MTDRIHHALGLHMHQPPGNLHLLIEANAWEAREIMLCYDRVARYALDHPDGRIHVGFSGILLEQFLDPDIQKAYADIVDIPAMLDRYRRATNIELLGMGYYHPIFPLIPERDWTDHLVRGRTQIETVFGRAPQGFWPPEMAFCMALVPHLARAGYGYVVVDGVHVTPEDASLAADVHRAWLAAEGGESIAVVPRDRDISNGQESGMDPSWFGNEARAKTAGRPASPVPPLVTTWSDGENGGWFRQTHEESGFFGHFFAPYMAQVRAGTHPCVPVALSDHLADHPPEDRARVRTGAWNVGSTSGYDLSQWSGSPTQKAGVERVVAASDRWWALQDRDSDGDLLEQARALILESETSCYLFWGDSWVPQLHARLDRAEALMDRLGDASP